MKILILFFVFIWIVVGIFFALKNEWVIVAQGTGIFLLSYLFFRLFFKRG
jgi:hypothetical protein